MPGFHGRLRYSTHRALAGLQRALIQLGFSSLDRAIGSAVSALEIDPTIFVVIGRAADGSVVYTSTELHELAKAGRGPDAGSSGRRGPRPRVATCRKRTRFQDDASWSRWRALCPRYPEAETCANWRLHLEKRRRPSRMSYI